MPGTNNKPPPSDFWHIYIWGFEYLWFVQSLFLIFLLVGVLDGLRLLDSRRNWWIALGISAVAFVFVDAEPEWNIFSVNGASRLLPFFLLGYALHRYPPRGTGLFLTTSLLAFVGVFTIRMLELVNNIPVLSGPIDKALAFTIGVTACTSLMLARKYLYLAPLAWLGPFAFGIYLLHVFGSAGIRIALERVGIDTPIVVFVACMLAAIGLSILFEVTFGCVRWISWGVLGQKPYKPMPYPPSREVVVRGGGTVSLPNMDAVYRIHVDDSCPGARTGRPDDDDGHR